jgi:stalled ribosome rescue protein Dom34
MLNGELNTTESAMLLNWFMVHMPMEQRHALMGELPVIYRHLFPAVNPQLITDKVLERMAEQA